VLWNPELTRRRKWKFRKSASLLTTMHRFRVVNGEPVFRYGNCFSGALIRALQAATLVFGKGHPSRCLSTHDHLYSGKDGYNELRRARWKRKP
jgi:hypothetical protein